MGGACGKNDSWIRLDFLGALWDLFFFTDKLVVQKWTFGFVFQCARQSKIVFQCARFFRVLHEKTCVNLSMLKPKRRFFCHLWGRVGLCSLSAEQAVLEGPWLGFGINWSFVGI